MIPYSKSKPPTSRPLTSLPGKSGGTKTFFVTPWSDSGEGTKILIYGKSGIGKTSLASLAPNPIFIGLDDGGRKIRNPKTGKPVNAILGITTFQDVRDALHQADLFPVGSSVVIDTVTRLEDSAGQHVLSTIKTEKGATASSLESYGWGKGYRHLLETVRLFLADLDALVHRGVHVVLLGQLAQARVANAEGADYVCDGPKLYHSNNVSIRTEVGEWVDHIFRIGYDDFNVVKVKADDSKGKVVGGNARSIFTDGPLHFEAKSRGVAGKRLPAIITYESPVDDSLWKMMFEGAIPE